MTKIGSGFCFVLTGSYLKTVVNSCGNIKLLQKVRFTPHCVFQELSSFQDDGPSESLPYTLHGYKYYNRKTRSDFLPLFCRKDGPSESLPYTLHGYKYYNRKTRSDFLPLFCRKKVGSDVEEVILNLDKEFPEGYSNASQSTLCSPVTVNNMLVSEDSRYLAYTIDTTGEELYNLYIKDLSSGQVEMIQRNVYSFCFGLAQGAARDIYYTVANNLMRTNRVYRHLLGQSATHDVPVFEEPSATHYCDVKRTNDRVGLRRAFHQRFMLLFSASKADSAVFLLRAGLDSPVLLIQRREQEE